VPDLTYSGAGLTADGGPPPPPGFRALRVRTALEAGSFERAADALLTWGMHRLTPLLRVEGEPGPAAPGVTVVLRMGPLRAPCRVVWAVREENRAGFGYGTLPGHPESGEESFLVRRFPDGSVDFTVFAVSRPAAWYVRLSGPCGRLAQKAAARQYGRTLRKMSRTPVSPV
jgi:uncharacterized protein (UPF0548 family)